MNILIADSGSTKTDWRVITDSGIFSIAGSGLNPHILSDEEIGNLLGSEVAPSIKVEIDQCYFYGAGITDLSTASRVEKVLQSEFNSSKTCVGNDLIGAARALLGSERGVIGILGTGSNSGFYDGDEIVEKVEAGGYILGDEGSGTALGKRLLIDFLRNNIPQTLFNELIDIGLSKAVILKNVYNSRAPNTYLASFSEFVFKHRETDYGQELIKRTLSEFIKNHLLTYKSGDKICLVGSIAYYYSTELKFLADAVGLSITQIEKSPIDGLVKYHKEY